MSGRAASPRCAVWEMGFIDASLSSSVVFDLPAGGATRARLVRAAAFLRPLDVALLERLARAPVRFAVEATAASAADPFDQRAARELPLAADLSRGDVLAVQDLVESLDA